MDYWENGKDYWQRSERVRNVGSSLASFRRGALVVGGSFTMAGGFDLSHPLPLVFGGLAVVTGGWGVIKQGLEYQANRQAPGWMFGHKGDDIIIDKMARDGIREAGADADEYNSGVQDRAAGLGPLSDHEQAKQGWEHATLARAKFGPRGLKRFASTCEAELDAYEAAQADKEDPQVTPDSETQTATLVSAPNAPPADSPDTDEDAEATGGEQPTLINESNGGGPAEHPSEQELATAEQQVEAEPAEAHDTDLERVGPGPQVEDTAENPSGEPADHADPEVREDQNDTTEPVDVEPGPDVEIGSADLQLEVEQADAEAEAESEAVAQPESEADTVSEAVAQPESEADTVSEAEPESESEAGSSRSDAGAKAQTTDADTTTESGADVDDFAPDASAKSLDMADGDAAPDSQSEPDSDGISSAAPTESDDAETAATKPQTRSAKSSLATKEPEPEDDPEMDLDW